MHACREPGSLINTYYRYGISRSNQDIGHQAGPQATNARPCLSGRVGHRMHVTLGQP